MEETREQQQETNFAKRLAASDKAIREKGISVLTKWLTAKNGVAIEDLKKIWKGLFYCMWHADKGPVQADLAMSLSAVLHELEEDVALKYFTSFLWTMRREWSGIDRLRIDKFYLLIRMMLRAALVRAASRGTETIRLFMDSLEQEILMAKDKYLALGINLHLSDIFIDELPKQISSPGQLRGIINPFITVLSQEGDVRLLDRVQESVFVKLGLVLRHGATKDGKEKGEVDPFDRFCEEDVAGIAERLFELASLPETSGKNRKYLYYAQRVLVKALKNCKKGSDKLESSPENISDLEEQVVQDAAKADDYETSEHGNGVHNVEEEEEEEEEEEKEEEETEEVEAEEMEENEMDVEEVEAEEEYTTAVEAGEVGHVDEANLEDKAAADNVEVEEGKTELTEDTGEQVEEEAVVAEVQIDKKKKKKRKRKRARGLEGVGGGGEAVLEIRANADSAVNVKEQKGEDKGTEEGQGGEREMGEANKSANAGNDDPSLSTPQKDKQPRARGNAYSPGIPGKNGEANNAEEGLDEDVEDVFETPIKNIVHAFSSPLFSDSEPEMKQKPEEGRAGAGKDEGSGAGPPKKRVKRVKFVLSKNVAFEKNGPVPPPSVRTPSGARPRGSALKRGVKPGPIDMKKLKVMWDTSPTGMTTAGRKKKKVVTKRPTRVSPLRLSSLLK